jgi:uncharacterized protein (TIGR03083 family)
MIPLVEHLAATWASIDELCTGFTDAEWATPTGCPGWTVQDQVAHLVDYEAVALGRPRPDHAVADLSHTKNDMGAANEVGVDARRAMAGAEVLAELREVVAARMERLARLDESRLADEAPTAVGTGTVRDALTLRLMDTWSHEQDIRRALARPGHATGPAIDAVLDWWTSFLPVLVGKRAAAPEGSTTVLRLVGRAPISVTVTEGRAGVDRDENRPATVELAMDAPTFAAFVGARTDAPRDRVTITGDTALGERVLAALGFLP